MNRPENQKVINFPPTQAEATKIEDVPLTTQEFFISVHTFPNFGYCGFVTLEARTMYSAWCEALRTLRLEPHEYITITPFKHLPENVQKYAREATPRQVIV